MTFDGEVECQTEMATYVLFTVHTHRRRRRRRRRRHRQRHFNLLYNRLSDKIQTNCHVDDVCCLDPTTSQITTLCTLHFMYNDKVGEIGEVPKLLHRLLDYQYTPLGRTNLPRWFKQDDLCRAKLLDNFFDHSLLKL